MEGYASGDDLEDELADDDIDLVQEDTKEDKGNTSSVNTEAMDTFAILYPLAPGRFVKRTKVKAKSDYYRDNSLDSGTSTDSQIMLKCEFQEEHTWLRAPLLDTGDTVPYWDDLKVTLKPFRQHKQHLISAVKPRFTAYEFLDEVLGKMFSAPKFGKLRLCPPI